MFVSIFWQKIDMTLAILVLTSNSGYVQRKKGILPVFSFTINM